MRNGHHHPWSGVFKRLAHALLTPTLLHQCFTHVIKKAKTGELHMRSANIPFMQFIPQRRNRMQRSESSPLDAFFANYYPEFEYDATESASLEFYRLCDQFGWDRDDPEREEAHSDFKNALVQQFNRLYGTDEDNLSDWQNLCYIVRVQPIPDDLDACREASTSCLSCLSFLWIIGIARLSVLRTLTSSTSSTPTRQGRKCRSSIRSSTSVNTPKPQGSTFQRRMLTQGVCCVTSCGTLSTLQQIFHPDHPAAAAELTDVAKGGIRFCTCLFRDATGWNSTFSYANPTWCHLSLFSLLGRPLM